MCVYVCTCVCVCVCMCVCVVLCQYIQNRRNSRCFTFTRKQDRLHKCISIELTVY